MTDKSPTLRELIEIEIAAVRREIANLERQIALGNDAHNISHAREHAMTEMAVTKADEAMTIRLGQMNEFREQINIERGTYSTKTEVRETMKRIEEMIGRNATAIIDSKEVLEKRLKPLEDFRIAAESRITFLQGMIPVVGVVLAAVGFILARIGV